MCSFLPQKKKQSQSVKKVKKQTYKNVGKPIIGVASYYSAKLDGTITATGDRYRNSKYTAASNQFPLNSWVRVTRLKSKKSVIVKINDRMHKRMQAKGRVVDLSGIAAKDLGIIKSGLAKVSVQKIKRS